MPHPFHHVMTRSPIEVTSSVIFVTRSDSRNAQTCLRQVAFTDEPFVIEVACADDPRERAPRARLRKTGLRAPSPGMAMAKTQ